MMRMSKLSSEMMVAGSTLALALGLLACSSSTPTDPGGFGGGTTSAPGTTMGNTNGGGGGNGTPTGNGNPTTNEQPGSNTGSNTTTGSNTNTGTNGSNTTGSKGTGSNNTGTGTGTTGTTMTGTGTTTSGANNGTPIPTAQGFTSGPPGATDLAVPDSTVGIQFVTPAGAYTVQPGQEIFPNYCVTVPSNIQVGGFQSYMTIGSSHHFILYKGGTGSASGGQCSLGAGQWMYATSTPGQVITENFPPQVGLSVAQNTQLIINMHFINTGSAPLQPQIKLNLLYAKNVMYQAGTMVSFNSTINVPAATSAGPGTQTVSGNCSAPTGAKFFTMSTHTHKHATAAWVDYIHNGQTTEVVHTGATSTYPADQEPGSGTDWEHPGVGLWVAPNYLTVAAGDSFTYHCSYSNTGSTAVTVGETAANNEMCMAIGYYFPAGSAYCQ